MWRRETGGRSVLRPPGVGASRGNLLLLGASRGEQVSEWGGTRTADPGQLGERLAGLTRGTCLTAAPGTGPDLPPKHPVCAEPERRRLAGGRHVRRGEGTPRSPSKARALFVGRGRIWGDPGAPARLSYLLFLKKTRV